MNRRRKANASGKGEKEGPVKNPSKPVLTPPPTAPDWPGLVLRELAPPGTAHVLLVQAWLDKDGRVTHLKFAPTAEGNGTEAALTAYKLAITAHLDALARGKGGR